MQDKRVVKEDENGFEVHFKPQKLGAYLALTIGIGLFVIDYILFRGTYFFGEFKFLLYNPLYLFGFIALKLGIAYTVYLTIYTLKSDYIVKLDTEKLSKYSAPIPRLSGNKSILRKDIESWKLVKSKSSTRISSDNPVRVTQIYYNLVIRLKNDREIIFFYSLSYDETYLIKQLLDKYLTNKK